VVAAARVPSPAVAELPPRVARVVAPLDGSRFSELAVPVAAQLSLRLDAQLSLFGAVGTTDEAVDRANRLARVARTLVGVPVETEVVVDADPAGAIHDAVRAHPDSVACMASHGRGRSAAILGSIANEVLVRGQDPLVLVGHLYDESRRGHGVVAAVDDSPAAPRVARLAAQWADLLRERLTVIVVAEPVPPPLDGGPVHRAFGPTNPESYLRELVESVRQSGTTVDVAAEVVYDPISPQSGILTYLVEKPSSYVVLGSRARTGLERLMFGSVAADVLSGGSVPLLAVPRLERRHEDPTRHRPGSDPR
jgi:nucleotide-binding universal stress UspA family protein